MKKNVTMKDIAILAEVSVATVSKALRGESDIGVDTQQKIVKIANSLGYSTNSLAIYLRNGGINALGILIPDNSNPYNALVLKGVEEKAKELGYNVIIGNTNGDGTLERELLKTFISMQVKGILAIPSVLDNYRDVSTPLIIMSRFPYRDISSNGSGFHANNNLNYIVNDDYIGEYMAAEHLIHRGYECICLILGSVDATTAEGTMNLTRLAGFRAALTEHHIPLRNQLIITDVTSLHESYRAVTELLEQTHLPIGLCMNTDYAAMAALSAIFDKNLSIPKDVGLVGYDDIDFAKYAVPALTTITQAKYVIGSQSVEHVVSPRYSKSDPWNKVLAPTLVIRKST